MDIDKIIDIIRNQKLNEMMGAGAVSGPTNNVGDGKIAGTVEAGDDPPVRKKKRYVYGGKGSRKMWMKNG
jgi:hypothetical protein|tara:strand:- start:175 stop:384 length:210 start_codon:yes stop_codon:yes gene_type:complete